ncbi:MAG: DUF7144 family membrane protein [Acidimicrobiales bacterium]
MSDQSYSNQPTGWVGWIFFAGVMMVIAGSLNIIYGLIAVLNDDWVVFGNTSAVLLDLSAWGWIHMIVGFAVLACGLGVFSGNLAARTVGVILAGLSLIANFLYLPVYPLWSIIVITIDALVIWALTAHGSEMKQV